MNYVTPLTRDQLTDALAEMIDKNIRDGGLTWDEWLEAVEEVLAHNEQRRPWNTDLSQAPEGVEVLISTDYSAWPSPDVSTAYRKDGVWFYRIHDVDEPDVELLRGLIKGWMPLPEPIQLDR